MSTTKDVVRARLAAGDQRAFSDQLASDNATADMRAAASRIGALNLVSDADINAWHVFGGVRKGVTVPEMIVDECVDLLRNAPLTINFEPHLLFKSPVLTDEIQTIWHDVGRKQPGYTDTRDAVEERMFGYSEADKSVGDVNIGQKVNAYGKIHSMDASGRPRANHMVAAMRPKYAAVNFTEAVWGAASSYGKSHFVLQPFVAMNATYCPRDSFGIEARSQVGTYFNMLPILVHCADYMLVQMIETVRSRRAGQPAFVPPLRPIQYLDDAGDNKKGSDYIEAHVHGAIKFRNDVKVVRVCLQELADKSTADPATLKRYTVKSRTMKRNLEGFLKRNGLKVEYF